jgi:RNA polymerase sigma-70 factor (ECF subfamily)
MRAASRLVGRRLGQPVSTALRGFFGSGHDAPLADDLLLAAMGSGDSEAALIFVRRFQRTVYGVAYATLGDSGLAEDVAQQAFERAWRQADVYDPRRGTVRAWLAKITHNLAVDTARVRRPTPVAPLELTDLIHKITPNPEDEAVAGEANADLAAALASLPPEQARAAVLAAAHGFTAREIAEAEGIPVGSAKSRIRLALEKLHAALPRGAEDG